MYFSARQIKATQSFMAQADELLIKILFASINKDQLKKILRTAEQSFFNKTKGSSCDNCHVHDVNKEDGVNICDSCLAE